MRCDPCRQALCSYGGKRSYGLEVQVCEVFDGHCVLCRALVGHGHPRHLRHHP